MHCCPEHGAFSERLWVDFNITGRAASFLPRAVDALIEIRAEQALEEIRIRAHFARREVDAIAMRAATPDPWRAVMVLLDDMASEYTARPREPGMYRVSLSAAEMDAHTVTVSPRRDR